MAGVESQSVGVQSNRKEKGAKYITWTPAMDRTLTSILLDQHALGNKGDGNGWKAPAYTAALKAIREECGITINKENVKSRLKTWTKYYHDISDMLTQSGFGWDYIRNTIHVDSENVWTNYWKSHPAARVYRNKTIENWEDLHTICGQDRARGDEAQTAVEADVEIINEEDNNDVELIGDNLGLDDINVEDLPLPPAKIGDQSRKARPTPMSKKRVRASDTLATVVSHMAKALDKFMASEESKPSAPVVFEEIYKVPDLDQMQRLKAGDLLMSDQRKFEFFTCLPVEMRKEWIMMHVGDITN